MQVSTHDWANQITPEGEIPSESDCPGYRRGDSALGMRRKFSSLLLLPATPSPT